MNEAKPHYVGLSTGEWLLTVILFAYISYWLIPVYQWIGKWLG